MPKLSTLIVSVLSMLIITGGASVTVLPPGLRREITVPYCEDNSDHLISVFRRDDHDNNRDASREELSNSAQEALAAPPCNNNFHCNLAHNRRKIKKYATAEAQQRAEMQPMLAEPSEIPFGARALEKGIQVEGIWTPDCHSARQSTAHSESRPESIASAPKQISTMPPGDNIQGPERTYQPVSNSNLFDPRSPSKVLDVEHGRLNDIYVSRTTRSPQLDSRGNIGGESFPDSEKHRSRGWFGARSSWVKKPFESSKRRSTHDGHRRTSSESFRRRISKLIDENIRTNPDEIYQLRAINQEAVEARRTASLTRSQGPSYAGP
ncbi:hypothetical protein BO78DRAFT_412795 [Aspergillus sclerotiicarbonarius CBS 121057]|uniref:Uncharacterized protein n=1 Tax=Aspergillus sclerotiicarbonarius (strain CBS 121057 / IBT 28362) TaxID=1448318 RepID=A0A319F3K1_ASPSB|nr:hypothetical protein BO78DRAFT_412795 [Aspergillus sclerotiicarbonarius CBS 121057]